MYWIDRMLKCHHIKCLETCKYYLEPDLELE